MDTLTRLPNITSPEAVRKWLGDRGISEKDAQIMVRSALAETAVMKKEFFQRHAAREPISSILARTQSFRDRTSPGK